MTIVPSTVMLAAAEAAEAAEFALRATVVNATSAKPRKSWEVMEGHGRSWDVMGFQIIQIIQIIPKFSNKELQCSCIAVTCSHPITGNLPGNWLPPQFKNCKKYEASFQHSQNHHRWKHTEKAGHVAKALLSGHSLQLGDLWL